LHNMAIAVQLHLSWMSFCIASIVTTVAVG
jgi:hypothetical protein